MLKKSTFTILTIVFILACQSAPKKDTKNDEAKAHSHYQLGMASFGKGDSIKAKRELAIAIDYAPDIPYYHNHLGLIYLSEKDYVNAEKHFQNSLSLDEKYTDVLNNLGVLHLEKKNLMKAKEYFLKVIADPIYPYPHYAETNLGIVARLEKNYEKAEFHLKKSIKIKSNYCTAYKELALCYDELGKNSEAAERYSQAVKLCPSYVEALYRGAIKHFVLKDDSKGKRFLKKCLEVEANNITSASIPFLRECVTLSKHYDITYVPADQLKDKKQIEGVQ